MSFGPSVDPDLALGLGFRAHSATFRCCIRACPFHLLSFRYWFNLSPSFCCCIIACSQYLSVLCCCSRAHHSISLRCHSPFTSALRSASAASIAGVASVCFCRCSRSRISSAAFLMSEWASERLDSFNKQEGYGSLRRGERASGSSKTLRELPSSRQKRMQRAIWRNTTPTWNLCRAERSLTDHWKRGSRGITSGAISAAKLRMEALKLP